MMIQRLYYNISDEIIRMDEIDIAILPPTISVSGIRIGNDPGLQMRIGPQLVKTSNYPVGSGYAPSDRTVSSIQLNGDFDDWDKTGSPYNMTWASKTLGNDQVVRFNMSNLPVIGDVV